MKMSRRSVLEGIGLLVVGTVTRGLTGAAGALLTASAALARAHSLAALAAPSCWLTPEKTEGPYYFDPKLIRRDITEGKMPSIRPTWSSPC